MAKKNPQDAATAAPKTAPEPAAKPESKAGPAAAPTKARRKASWVRITVMVLFGLLYAYDLFEAISNLFGKVDEIGARNQVRELNGFAPLETPWVFLISNLLLPIVVYLLATLIGRRRSVWVHAVVYLAGLGVVAAVSLTLVYLVRTLY